MAAAQAHEPPALGAIGYASLAQLRAAAPIPERDVRLANGMLVRIRKLSRGGQLALQQVAGAGGETPDLLLAEQLVLCECLVIPPVPDKETAAALQVELDPDVLSEIITAITAFSGVTQEAAAARAAEFRSADAG